MDVCFHVCFHACAVTVTPGHYTVVRNAVVAMGHCMQLGIETKWVLYICAFIDSIISTSSVKVQGFGLVSLWTVKKSCDLISAPGSYINKYCTLLCWISRFITTRGMQYSMKPQAEWNIAIPRVVMNLISNTVKVQYLFCYTHYTCIQNCCQGFEDRNGTFF